MHCITVTAQVQSPSGQVLHSFNTTTIGPLQYSS